jgi:hypothetical protein
MPKSEPFFLAVSKEVPPNPELVKLIEEFKHDTKSMKTQMPGPNVPRIYMGAHFCSQCHTREYMDWQTTSHSLAMHTLTDRGQQSDPECLKCHTTGFRQANGFYTIADDQSKVMVNVQCEVCHGPAAEHGFSEAQIVSGAQNRMSKEQFADLLKKIRQTLPTTNIPPTVCLKCHTPENDNHFVYAEKIKKVNHLKHSAVPSPMSGVRIKQSGK